MSVRGSEHSATHTLSASMSRRGLMARLAAAGFSSAAVAGSLASTANAQDATPGAEATPTPQEVLESIGKDSRLIPYGSTTFGAFYPGETTISTNGAFWYGRVTAQF